MKKITALLLSLSVILSVSLCGCNNDNPDPEQTTELITQPEPTPFPIIINDVEIKDKPEKVVCLSPALAEIMYEMGYSDLLVGRSSYCDYPPQITAIKEVGGTTKPDIDAIIQLQPDLVLSSAPIASKDIFNMQQSGIATVVIPAPTTLDGFSSIYKAMGLIFEGMFTGTEKGESIYADISQALGNTDNLNVGKFVYITENMTAAGGNTFESAILSCFGTNLAAQAEDYAFDLEYLTENQPDVIFVNSIYKKEDLEANEIFAELEALANDKIVFIDNSYLERPTRRIIELTDKIKASANYTVS
ncbi:MAG: helical backbone metal receptor [Firmicutes bacterium]|nr:helical backbone metal receptor [[Eubacterium] siraeum]MCM1487348.1 helical backbone metal receptor [Bacillota bacterium]